MTAPPTEEPPAAPPAPDGIPARPRPRPLAPGRFERVPGAATDVGVGAAGHVWVVGRDPAPGGQAVRRRHGDTWQQVPGGARRISVDPWGDAWAVDEDGGTFRWDDRWIPVPGRAEDIGIGADGSVWKIGRDYVAPSGHTVSRWNGRDWDVIDGAWGRTIAVDPVGNAWVVTNPGRILRWSARGWEQVPGEATDIGIGADGTVWTTGARPAGRDRGYPVTRWDGRVWVTTPGTGVSLAVDPEGLPWVTDYGGALYRGRR